MMITANSPASRISVIRVKGLITFSPTCESFLSACNNADVKSFRISRLDELISGRSTIIIEAGGHVKRLFEDLNKLYY